MYTHQELEAKLYELQLEKNEIEIKYSTLYRKTIEICKSFNRYVAENPKDEYNTDDEYDSNDESDDDMIPFKNNMKPDDWHSKTESDEEALDCFDLH